jgi:hypothetical protein
MQEEKRRWHKGRIAKPDLLFQSLPTPVPGADSSRAAKIAAKWETLQDCTAHSLYPDSFFASENLERFPFDKKKPEERAAKAKAARKVVLLLLKKRNGGAYALVNSTAAGRVIGGRQ